MSHDGSQTLKRAPKAVHTSILVLPDLDSGGFFWYFRGLFDKVFMCTILTKNLHKIQKKLCAKHMTLVIPIVNPMITSRLPIPPLRSTMGSAKPDKTRQTSAKRGKTQQILAKQREAWQNPPNPDKPQPSGQSPANPAKPDKPQQSPGKAQQSPANRGRVYQTAAVPGKHQQSLGNLAKLAKPSKT